MLREPISTIYDIRQILSGVLNALSYLHSLPEPIIHNEITPQNVMLDLSTENPAAKIIDFGYARLFLQSSETYCKENLNLQYIANECIPAGVFSPQSDLFSVGVVMYQMLFGMLPWHTSNNKRLHPPMMEQCEKSLRFPNIAGQIIDFDESILSVIQKALHNNPEYRFQTAQEFSQVLNGEIEINGAEALHVHQNINTTAQNPIGQNNHKKHSSDKKAKDFADIAEMQELKNMLQSDVIDVIHNPEEYRLHNLGLPNGMLLWGIQVTEKLFCRTFCQRSEL
jgi:transitional endoplasmic reticulum ATPase